MKPVNAWKSRLIAAAAASIAGYTQLIYTGRTSMHVAVDVRAADPRTPAAARETTRCVTVFVALDEEGRPTPVPAWEPATPEDVAMRDYAVRLMELRKQVEQAPPDGG